MNNSRLAVNRLLATGRHAAVGEIMKIGGWKAEKV